MPAISLVSVSRCLGRGVARLSVEATEWSPAWSRPYVVDPCQGSRDWIRYLDPVETPHRVGCGVTWAFV
jgi:hypothetical protein